MSFVKLRSEIAEMKKTLILLPILFLLIVACGSDAGETISSHNEDYENEEVIEAGENGDSASAHEDEEGDDYEDAIEPDGNGENGAEQHETEPLPPLLEFATDIFKRLQEAWDEDDGEMWGVPLHTPVMIVCFETFEAVANRPYEPGDFIRQYVDGFTVYTGTHQIQQSYVFRERWGDQIGIFATLQSLEELRGIRNVYDRYLSAMTLMVCFWTMLPQAGAKTSITTPM